MESKYHIKKKLGEGVYGEVFLILDDNGNSFALKMYKTDEDEDDNGICPLRLREICILQKFQKLKLPHLMSCIKVYSIKKKFDSILMPFYKLNLQKIMKQQKLNLNEIKRISRQILQGISNSHSVGVLHRDIKPDNILTDENRSNFVLADFGLSGFDTNIRFTIKSHDVATLDYRPPEVLLCYDKYDSSIDIWSIAVVILEMITTTTPWNANFVLDNNNNYIASENAVIYSMFSSLGYPLHDFQLKIPLSIKENILQFPTHSFLQVKTYLSRLLCPHMDYPNLILAIEFFALIFQYDWRLRPNAQSLLRHKFLEQEEIKISPL